MHFAKLNHTLTGNVSRGLCFENICGPRGSFQIDVETEEGRVKGSGTMSKIHTLPEVVIAQGTEDNLFHQLRLVKRKVGNNIQEHEYNSIIITKRISCLILQQTDRIMLVRYI